MAVNLDASLPLIACVNVINHAYRVHQCVYGVFDVRVSQKCILTLFDLKLKGFPQRLPDIIICIYV
jgi:hypothetical protein